MAETALTKIDRARQFLSTVSDISDARTLLSIAQGLTETARKQWKSTELLTESKEARDYAYNVAVNAGELRLLAEARLGELIKVEQEAGRLAKAEDNLIQNRTDIGVSSVKTLKEIGLSWKDSSRAQLIAEHKDLIPQLVVSVRRLGDIPTRKAFEKLVATQHQAEPQNLTPIPQRLRGDSDIITGDFSLLYDKLADDSVDLFFTDPPYNKDSVDLYEGLAKLAQAKLKAGGLCLAYAGQSHLSLIYRVMSLHLDYWWTFAIFLSGAEQRIWSKSLWVRWKPVVVFTKKPADGRLTGNWCLDYIRGDGQDKRYHQWGQPVNEASYWIDQLSPPGGLIVDPFCGAGTIPLAAKLATRRYVATEIDPVMANTARQRILEVANG